MRNFIANDAGPSKQNTSILGLLPYRANDYGANWATAATITADLADLFPVPQNGCAALLYNTDATGAGAKIYAYANNAWGPV
jgi:hypothetical protein